MPPLCSYAALILAISDVPLTVHRSVALSVHATAVLSVASNATGYEFEEMVLLSDFVRGRMRFSLH